MPGKNIAKIVGDALAAFKLWADTYPFSFVFSFIGMAAGIVALVSFVEAKDQARMQKLYQAWQLLNSSQSSDSLAGRAIALADLYSADQSLIGIRLDGARVEKLNLSNANFRFASFDRTVFQGVLMQNAELSAIKARNAAFKHSCFIDAKLDDADLRGVDFYRSDLRGADLNGANLSGARLEFVQLDGATLINADLSDADVKGASFRGVDLSGANLSGLRNWRSIKSIKDAVISGTKNQPEDFRLFAKKEGAEYNYFLSKREVLNKYNTRNRKIICELK